MKDTVRPLTVHEPVKPDHCFNMTTDETRFIVGEEKNAGGGLLSVSPPAAEFMKTFCWRAPHKLQCSNPQ